MRLFEAIIDANHLALDGSNAAAGIAETLAFPAYSV